MADFRLGRKRAMQAMERLPGSAKIDNGGKSVYDCQKESTAACGLFPSGRICRDQEGPMSTRRSPAQFRSKAASIVAFFLSLALVAGAVYLGYQALFFDYSGYLPSGATVREYLPEGGAYKINATAAPSTWRYGGHGEARPTGQPTASLSCTPPGHQGADDGTNKLGQVGLTLCEPSARRERRDDGAGWGYIRARDASEARLPCGLHQERRGPPLLQGHPPVGSPDQHEPSTGTNWTRADFAWPSAWTRIRCESSGVLIGR